MKKRKSTLNFYLAIAFMICSLAGCAEYEDPGIIYDSSASFAREPIISGIQPKDSAIGGVREISIVGENFSTNKFLNRVYFDGSLATIKSATATRLVIYRPLLSGDSIKVKAMVQGALGLTTFANIYKIEQAVYPYDSRDIRFASFTNKIFCVELDKDENFYFSSFESQGSVVYKVPPGGSLSTFKNLSVVNFPQLTDMKFGPGGFLYLSTGKTRLWRTLAGTGNPEQYALLPREVSFMDFDQSGNLYAGGKSGIYVIHPDKSFKFSGRYESNFVINRIRYYNGAIYLAASYGGSDASIAKMAIWKNQIIGSDSLAGNELVLDLGKNPEFSSSAINWFDVDINGTIYLCLRNHPRYSLFVLENDGSITPFYTEGIIPYGVDHLVWGNGRSAYLNRGITVFNAPNADSVRVYRLVMEYNGAPYRGRQ